MIKDLRKEINLESNQLSECDKANKKTERKLRFNRTLNKIFIPVVAVVTTLLVITLLR